MIKDLIDANGGMLYIPFFHDNDLETTFNY